MMLLETCPECKADNTDRQMVEFESDGIEIVYTCYECSIDFTVWCGASTKTTVHEYDK